MDRMVSDINSPAIEVARRVCLTIEAFDEGVPSLADLAAAVVRTGIPAVALVAAVIPVVVVVIMVPMAVTAVVVVPTTGAQTKVTQRGQTMGTVRS